MKTDPIYPRLPRSGRQGGRFRLPLGQHGAMLLSAGGLMALIFLAGMAVAEFRLFPSGVLREAVTAARDWHANWRHYLQIRSRFARLTELSGSGVTGYDPTAAFPGYTFLTAYRDGSYHALLIDMAGVERHEWKIAYSDVWPDPPHLPEGQPDFDASIHGAVLLPGGEVVMNFDGAGTVKLDRCSRVLWSVAARTHHAIAPLPDGGFLIPARRQLRHPGPDLPGVRVPESGWLWEDTLLHVGPNGRVLAEFSLLKALLDSGLEAILYANGKLSPTLGHTDDPLHVNDVEVLPADLAGAFPMFSAGDIMISMLSLNTIAVLDPLTRRVKWSMTGPFLRQHDPDFLPNGHIMVFDNRKGGQARKFGFSEILEIDPARREVVWRYAGSDHQPFYTDALGKQQALPNGNVLVTEPYGGRVFELARTPAAGNGGSRIVWEWLNKIDDGFVAWVTQADRAPASAVGFLSQPACP